MKLVGKNYVEINKGGRYRVLGEIHLGLKSTFGKLKKKIAFQHVNINLLYIGWDNFFFLTQLNPWYES